MAKPRVVNVQFNNEQIFWGEYANHILAEGDSWFGWAHMNLVPSSNLLEELRFEKSTVVVSYAYSGDTITNMADLSSNSAFAEEVRSNQYEAILLSGGGNDLIDALPHIIRPCTPAAPPATALECVNEDALRTLLHDFVLPNYRQIINHRAANNLNTKTPVVIHTYDYPTPRDAPATFMGGIPASGPWLWRALRDAQVPEPFDQTIADHVFGALRHALKMLDNANANVHVVDTSDTIERAVPGAKELSGDWINEIHPDAHGYALIAARLNQQLRHLNVQ